MKTNRAANQLAQRPALIELDPVCYSAWVSLVPTIPASIMVPTVQATRGIQNRRALDSLRGWSAPNSARA